MLVFVFLRNEVESFSCVEQTVNNHANIIKEFEEDTKRNIFSRERKSSNKKMFYLLRI
jgi:hypothetical protein